MRGKSKPDLNIQSGAFGIVLIIAGILILVAVAVVYLGITPVSRVGPVIIPQGDFGNTSNPPTKLYLPIKTGDISGQKGLVNPFGVVRGSKDLAEVGHPGIDLPLKKGSEVYAVADGEIVDIEEAGDAWGGMKVVELLEKVQEGEGWVFIYEHIDPKVKVGDKVKRGEVMATTIAEEGFTSHFQLAYATNKYRYYENNQCWPEALDNQSKIELQFWFNTQKLAPSFVAGWQSVNEERMYQFRELLNKSKFPNGPQLCYPEGTDVRISVE